MNVVIGIDITLRCNLHVIDGQCFYTLFEAKHLRWIIPAVPHADRVAMLKGMRANAPAEAFERHTVEAVDVLERRHGVERIGRRQWRGPVARREFRVDAIERGDQRIRGRSGYQYAEGETADTVDVARAGRLHILEVQAIADDMAATKLTGRDPVRAGELTMEEIEKGQADANYELDRKSTRLNSSHT